MTLLLKDYQARALESLEMYFKECVRLNSADSAFYETTKKTLGLGQGVPYRAVKELPGLPYVCIRIPTGGGKTFVACHAVKRAADHLLHTEAPLVLWLVPSNQIREQTVKALKDRKHPYRQAVEAGGRPTTVLDITEARSIQPGTLDTGPTIIVSTQHAFRVTDTEGRKVYEDSGALMSHFTNLSDVPTDAKDRLDKTEGGGVVRSLANVLKLCRPIVIVDEAHNARTPLMFDTLARFNPSCIIEFTATPDKEHNPSNVIYSVSAYELKTDNMIKMPIKLEARRDWKELLRDAIHQLDGLQKAAEAEGKQTGEYIRPIMLLQAQPEYKTKDSLKVEVLEKALLEDFRIPPEAITRATGKDRGLEDVDLSKPDCAIRFIITVQALKEGWDCPFAYVLYTVSEIRTSTAVEQILGRVLRQPNARRKNQADLNFAYAFAASAHFSEAANALADALVENGFEKQEAKDFITPIKAETGKLFDDDDGGLFAKHEETIAEAPKASVLTGDLAEKVTYDKNTQTLTVIGIMEESDKRKLLKAFTTPEAKEGVERLYQKSQGRSPVSTEPPVRFAVPLLAVKQGNLFEVFDEQYLDVDWKLTDYNANLDEKEFPSDRPAGVVGEVDVTDKGKVEAKFVSGVQAIMSWFATDANWDQTDLVRWLDRHIPHMDIPSDETTPFLAGAVARLLKERGLTLAQLVHDKFRLKQALEDKISEHRAKVRRGAYKEFLLPDFATPLIVSPKIVFSYDADSYLPHHSFYEGRHRFQNHLFPRPADLKSEGEEFDCACFIDALPEVKKWVRNVQNKPNDSFWLRTSTDRFYPDFVCLLNDGRYLVVEYKGKPWAEMPEEKEKNIIGRLWAERSGGKCLFAMPVAMDFEAIRSVLK